MVAGGYRIIAGDALNLVVSSSLSNPTHGHTLVTYTPIDNRTTSTVDRTGTTIKLAAIEQTFCFYCYMYFIPLAFT